MYEWRKMTAEQRASILKLRKSQRRPWHSPPHLDLEDNLQYLVTAACYDHTDIIGKTPERMAECKDELLRVTRELCSEIYAWCVLPNHYHWLLKTERIYATPSASFTAVHPIGGMSNTRREGERFGSTVLSAL